MKNVVFVLISWVIIFIPTWIVWSHYKDEEEERKKEIRVAYVESMRNDAISNANEVVEQIKVNMENEKFTYALNVYISKETEILDSIYLDSDFKDNFKKFYDDIIYGLFFYRYASLTEDPNQNYILSDAYRYIDQYNDIDMEKLSSKTQGLIESVVAPNVEKFQSDFSELAQLERENVIRNHDATWYIGKYKEIVLSDFGRPDEIDDKHGPIPEDRITVKERWYYRENRQLIMFFDIGKHGEVLNAFKY